MHYIKLTDTIPHHTTKITEHNMIGVSDVSGKRTTKVCVWITVWMVRTR